MGWEELHRHSNTTVNYLSSSIVMFKVKSNWLEIFWFLFILMYFVDDKKENRLFSLSKFMDNDAGVLKTVSV